jgi:hypothetical protein
MTEKIIAESAATWRREWGTDPRDPDTPAGPGEVATEDTLIERPDLPTDSHVLVVKGDRIPRELVEQPARPVERPVAETARKRKYVPPKD